MSNPSGRSRSRSISRSRSPPYHSGSRNRYRSRQVSSNNFLLYVTESRSHGFELIYARSRSFSPAPRRQGDYSVSPRRHAERPRSPRSPPRSPPVERDADHKRRSYSPLGYGNDVDQNQSNGYAE